jgi:MFS family permease
MYLVPAIISGIVTGAMARSIGLRKLLSLTVIVLTAGFGLAIVAPSFEALLFARFLQGIGAGWGAALSFLLIRRFFVGADMARGFVIEAIVYAVGAAGGPLLAGWLLEVGSWRVVFGVDLLLTLGLWIIGRHLLQKPRPQQTNETPPAAVIKLTPDKVTVFSAIVAGVVLLVAAGIVTPGLWTIVLLIPAVAMGVFAVKLDQRRENKIFPTELLSPKTAAGSGMIATFLLGIMTTPISIYVPLIAEELLSLRPAFAGIMATLLALAWSVTAMASSTISRDQNIRRALLTTPVLHGVFAMVFIIALWQHSSILMGTALIGLGTGYGLCWAFLQDRTIRVTQHDQADLCAALLPSIFTLGNVLGSLEAGLFANIAGLDNSADPETLVDIGTWSAQNTVVLAIVLLVAMWRFNYLGKTADGAPAESAVH